MYGKIFASIFDSTLVSEGGWLPTYIFMSMITIADKDGVVGISSKALYSRLGFRGYDSKISFKDFNNAIGYLEQEDPESNSIAENGRRIIPLSNIPEMDDNRGWLIVNYEEYKKKASKHDERESTAERVRRFRERQSKKDGVTGCNGLKRNNNGKNGHIDTDLDTDIDLNNTPLTPQGEKPKKKKKKDHKRSTIEIYENYIQNVNPPKAHVKKQPALNNISQWEHEYSKEQLKVAALNYNLVKNKDFVKGPSNFYGTKGESAGFFKDFLSDNFDVTHYIEKEPQCQYVTITDEKQLFGDGPQ